MITPRKAGKQNSAYDNLHKKHLLRYETDMKKFELFFGLIKIPTDLIMTISAFMAAYQLRLFTESIPGFAKPIDYSVLPTLNEYLNFSLGAALTLLLIFTAGKMYSLKTTFPFFRESGKVIILWGIWMMAIITYFFFTRTLPFSRLAILYSWSLALIFILMGRGLIKIIQNIFLSSGVGKRNLLFIGNNNITEEIYKHLKNNISYKIIGFVGNEKGPTTLKYLGNTDQIEKIAKAKKIDEIIQTKSDEMELNEQKILELTDIYHINYRFIPDLLDVRRTHINIETISGIPIISLLPTPLDGWGKVIKRITDIIGSLFALTLFSPIILITAIAIKLDSKGPVIFSRLDNGKPVKRIGQYGKPFKFYKFRSMKPKTDSLRYTELSNNNIRSDGPLVKIKNDPRITRVGNFIRKYSIDEIPQLWSVLKGDMSLVGPRPHLPEEVSNYKNHHRFVFTIKPGITGLAQISGRSDLTFEEEIKLDRFYIEKWSIFKDIKIILKTFLVIFRGYRE